MKTFMNEKLDSCPKCCSENVVLGEKYRITVLTDGLLRLEYDEEGKFEDRATQVVLNRNFPKTKFDIKETEEQLEIFTERIHLIYNKREFSSFGLNIKVLGNISNYHSIWHYGDKVNDMGGTARTLDRVNGACELEHGLMSRFGFAILDDSSSLILTEDNWVEPRKKRIKDIYFWGYGHDYLLCLKDFYHLCGKTPMLPRYALGNWWSRYYEYTEKSYMELVSRFEKEKVPFSVAVIDMDWHLVDIDSKYGSGWTGYTWNRDMFPDPERFLNQLHQHGMKTTLNVHPADGVRAYEEKYTDMANAMGIDPSSQEPVNFDISSRKFMEAYFDILHHPYEEMGVDFWWIDWQQGSNSRVEGLDPLWMLNHYHFLDSGRDGKRCMTFSRFGGPGTHRYPVGFSGDTYTTWESLDFQPYFTNTASNIGYGWWSHDIGGHMEGYKDNNMAVRWLQYGAFSPINRMHSTKDPFYSKEPWYYEGIERETIDTFLRLRHELIPYLYTMNHRAYAFDQPLVWPMYYIESEKEEAYQVPNQYWFGSELIVAPITSPDIEGINKGKVKVWLPEGIYIDIFTHMIYRGGRFLDMYRDINSIPVLAKAGAILPMTREIFGKEALENPESLVIKMYAGANGNFVLYEDDNETSDYLKNISVETKIQLDWDQKRVDIFHAQGEISLIPEFRNYTLELYGCTCGSALLYRNGIEENTEISYDSVVHCLSIVIQKVSIKDDIAIKLSDEIRLTENEIKNRVFDFLNQAEIEYSLKKQIYKKVSECNNTGFIISELNAMKLNENLLGSLIEIITAY